jgi:hypothetical protein
MTEVDWKYAPHSSMSYVNYRFAKWVDRKELIYSCGNWLNTHENLSLLDHVKALSVIEMRPDPWAEGKERMENIVRNSGEGEHYDEVDNVNHPEHYQSDNGIECIDAIRAALGHDGFIAYCRGNAIKYNWRSGSKSSHSEDLNKGAWYSTRAAKELEEVK